MFSKQAFAHVISTVVRFKVAVILATFLVGSLGAVVLTVSPGSAAADQCTPPGVVVTSDATGDQTAGVTGATSAHDIVSVSVAEQYPAGAARLVFTMKVAGLSNTPPANTNWRTFFTATHADGTSTIYFVTATTVNPPGMTFKYGFVDTTATGTTNLTVGDADGGSFSVADSTLTVVLAVDKLKKPVAGTPNSTLTGAQVDLSAGKQLTAVNGFCSLLAGTGAVGGSNVTMDTTGSGTYTMAGSVGCANQPSPTPTPTENSCFAPGVTIHSDPAADQTGAPNANQQLDIQKISIAEPFTNTADRSITFTMKVANLNAPVQPNSTWQVSFNAPDTSGTMRTMFVTMNTSDNPAAVSYNYGYTADGFNTSQCFLTCDFVSGSFTPEGTITIKLKTDSALAFSDVNGAAAFTADLSQPGITLSGIGGDTTLLIGAAGTGAIQTVDDTPATGTYRTIGNLACQNGGGTPTPTPTPSPTASATPTPTPTPDAGTPQYVNYYPPSGVAEEWGEPSIGANWITGNIMFFGGINNYALRAKFDDTTSPAQVTWFQTPLISNTAPRAAGDPILVTDRETGRTFVSQLMGLTPSATLDITDNDGTSYTPAAGFGIASGIDHQTIGVAPFHAPMPAGATYRNAVYYCAQEGINSSGNGIANCALSINGGLTFGPAVPVYIVNGYNSCAPLHGHIKGAPDGTVYLPNRKCGNGAGLVVSEDNGVTWTARTIPNSSVGDSDASVGVATDGTIFLGYEGSDGHARIAVSHDKGVNWLHHTDVGTQVGVQNAIFPAVVAGDGGVDKARGAFAFYGSATPGDQDSPSYRGIWYLYVASTFDGGRTWTTVNATPNDPMQRDGICTRGFQGCVVPRNLLDFFDATVDKEGRVLVGYQDGCQGSCVQGGPNTNSEKGVIARQSGGRRMFAAYDPIISPTPTPTPTPTATPTPTPSPTPTPNPTPTPLPGDGTQVIEGTYDPHVYPCATQRHRFNVPAGKSALTVQVNADTQTNDLSVSLLYGTDPNAQLVTTEDTGTCCETLLYRPSGGVPAGEYQVQVCQTPNTQGVPQNAPFTYKGTFSSVGASASSPTPTPTPTATPTPTPTPTATPTPTPGPAAPPAVFGRNTIADFSAIAGEPFIRVDRQDNIFVSAPFGVSTSVSLLWKSSDGGRTFIPLGTPTIRDAVVGPGGGDTAHDFDDRNRLYYSDLSAACVTVAVSEDGGNTFPAAQNNPLTCVGSGDNIEGAEDDRQWVAAFGDGIAYMTVRNLAVSFGSGNFHLSKTTDAGKTWHGQIIGNVTQSGPLAIDRTKRKVTIGGVERDAILLYQLYYTSNTLKVLRITDLNDGSPLIVNDLHVSTPGGSVAEVFPVLAVDRQGNVYVAWSNGSNVFMVYSTNRGQSWSSPFRVSPDSLAGTNIMPWIVAGDAGRIDIAWYRTAGGNNAQAMWDLYMGQSLDALSSAPSFTVNKVNENTVHRGEICLDGLGCDLSTLQGEPRDRSFLEFPSIDIDSKGAAYLTYDDDTNQLPAPNVMVARQIGGASLYTSVGTLGSSGTVTVAEPAAGTTVRSASMTLSGTHTLTPQNFDRDESGDAKYPDHGAVVGSNIPALDIKSVAISENGNSLSVTMQAADLTTTALASAPALAGGDGVLYLTQWRFNNNIYWLGAEFRAGQVRYLTGSLGTINSATSKKYITYDPDLVNSLSVTGEVTRSLNGTIKMTIPKSLVGNPGSGAKFTSVTGYAFSQHGALLPMAAGQPNPSSMPTKVDASGAATYFVGQGGPTMDGVVEVSIDDPNFNSPRVASLVGDPVNSNGWSLQLNVADLPAGAHTAYVRQRINGRNPSAVVSREFSVANTIEGSVSSLVSFTTANPKSSNGVSSFDLSMKNISAQTISAPVRIEVASITSASGTVTVANADNALAGAGASWDYSAKLGADGVLSPNEVSGLRNLKFNNPRNEAFTVTFNVIGNLPRGSGGSMMTSGGSSSGDNATAEGSSTQSSSTAAITSVLFQLTYNPLLNTVSIQVLKP